MPKASSYSHGVHELEAGVVAEVYLPARFLSHKLQFRTAFECRSAAVCSFQGGYLRGHSQSLKSKRLSHSAGRRRGLEVVRSSEVVVALKERLELVFVAIPAHFAGHLPSMSHQNIQLLKT